MEVLIENYRGYEIRFNTEKETFVCDIDGERSVKKSYPALKKFIDEFIKDNNEFRPAWFIKKRDSFGGRDKKIKIVGVRKDGRFIYENEKGEKGQVSTYDEKGYMMVLPENEQILKELEVLDEKHLLENEKYRQATKELESKLKIVNLKEWKS